MRSWPRWLQYFAVALAAAAIAALGVRVSRGPASWLLVPLLVLLAAVGGFAFTLRGRARERQQGPAPEREGDGEHGT